MPNDQKLERDGVPGFDVEYVKLGDHNYEVVPQRLGYLRSKLGQVFNALTEVDQDVTGVGDVLALLGDRVYDVLKVLIPDLMPKWEFAGFATQEAMDANDYDERYDKSPDPRQVALALQITLALNRLDLIRHLTKIVDPTLARAYINRAIAESMESATTTSQNLPVPSTDGPSTTSGQTPPIDQEQTAA
jgi:hypothetical protein